MKPATSSPASIVFGILNLVLSLLPTIGCIFLLIYTFDLDDYHTDFSYESRWMSYYQLHWLLLLGPVSLLSACFLLAGKRIGWSGSVISGFCHAAMLVFLIRFLGLHADEWVPLASVLLLYHLLSLFFLWRPRMHEYCRVNTNTIVITGGILFALCADIYLAIQHFWK